VQFSGVYTRRRRPVPTCVIALGVDRYVYAEGGAGSGCKCEGGIYARREGGEYNSRIDGAELEVAYSVAGAVEADDGRCGLSYALVWEDGCGGCGCLGEDCA
jgi:hypothetical protein